MTNCKSLKPSNFSKNNAPENRTTSSLFLENQLEKAHLPKEWLLNTKVKCKFFIRFKFLTFLIYLISILVKSPKILKLIRFRELGKFLIHLSQQFTERKYMSLNKSKFKKKQLVTKKSPEKSLPQKLLKWSTKVQLKSVS